MVMADTVTVVVMKPMGWLPVYRPMRGRLMIMTSTASSVNQDFQ